MSKPAARLALVVVLISFFFLLSLNPAWAAEKTKVKFAVSWVIYGAFAPWFLALDKGYYSQEGLEVEISRGYGGADNVKRLGSGDRDIAMVDPASLILGRAKGAKQRLVAVVYEKAPPIILSLKKTGIRTIKDLEGRTLGSAPGSAERVLLPILFKGNNTDAGKVSLMNLDPAQTIPMLVAGKVDAITTFLIDVPIIEKEAAPLGGVDVILFADYGLDIYGLSVGVTDDYALKSPEAIRRFLRASIKGWDDSRRRSEEAADALLKYNPALTKEVVRASLEMTLKVSFTEATRRYGWGSMTEEKMRRTRDIVVAAYSIKEPIKPEEIYTNDFLK